MEELEARGLKFVGRDVEGKRMEIMELDGQYLVATVISIVFESTTVCPCSSSVTQNASGLLHDFFAQHNRVVCYFGTSYCNKSRLVSFSIGVYRI